LNQKRLPGFSLSYLQNLRKSCCKESSDNLFNFNFQFVYCYYFVRKMEIACVGGFDWVCFVKTEFFRIAIYILDFWKRSKWVSIHWHYLSSMTFYYCFLQCACKDLFTLRAFSSQLVFQCLVSLLSVFEGFSIKHYQF
jgi:hypothetical protein